MAVEKTRVTQITIQISRGSQGIGMQMNLVGKYDIMDKGGAVLGSGERSVWNKAVRSACQELFKEMGLEVEDIVLGTTTMPKESPRLTRIPIDGDGDE